MSIYLKRRKKFFKKILIGISLFSLGVAGFHGFAWLQVKFPFFDFAGRPYLPLVLMSVICLFAYKPLDTLVNNLFKNYIFRKKSYAHITLMNLAEDLALILDLQELANLIVNTFGEILHLKTVGLVVPARGRDDYEILTAYGWNVSDYRRVRLQEDSPLIRWVRMNGPHVIVRDRVVRSLPWQEANRLMHDFDSLRAGWVIPLFVKEEFIGFIAFSAVESDTVFDEADFHFFREFASPAAKYIRNALSVQELRVANSELQDIQSQLIQTTKIAAIEQLATGIAHEIHNPLTIISGKVQVLLLKKDRAAIDHETEEILKTIVKQTKRAADITRKLLMFSQGSGAPKEMLRLEQVLEDTIALVSYRTSLDGITFHRNIGADIPPFYGNVHELREIFLNLILNAVQSIRSQGEIHIDLKYHPADELIELQVLDTGRGIDQDHLEKVFNPFFTTRHEAVGLGLFVTKQIVHRYGGSIRLESRKDSGSLFIVRFPYMEGAQTIPEAGQEKMLLSLFPDSQ